MIFRFLLALWSSILPLGLLTGIGALAYFSFDGLIGILIGLFFLLIACLSSIYTFKTVMKVGVMKFMSTNSSSSDLDNLVATPSDSFQTMQIEKLVNSFKKEPTNFPGGTLKIWGDWQGRNLDKINEIEEINYEEENAILTINYKNRNRLRITKPVHIIAGKTYLKIIKAEKIEWQWEHILDDFKFSKYTCSEKKIDLDSNVKWSNFRTFLSLGEPALMINYKFNNSIDNDVILNSFIDESQKS